MKATDLSKLVKACRKTLDEAERKARGRKQMTEALRDALQETYKIWKKSKGSPNARKKVLQEYKIEEVPERFNLFNPYVRLCIPDRQPNDYNRYASALKYFNEQDWSATKVRKQLGEKSLTYFSEKGRKPRSNKAKDRPVIEEKRVTLAKDYLNALKPISVLDMSNEVVKPIQDDWALFIGHVPSDLDNDNIEILASVQLEPEQLNEIFKAFAAQVYLPRKEMIKKHSKKRA